VITLEGRVAGPWAAELDRTWAELAPSIGRCGVSLDLRNTIYADAAGMAALREICSHTGAEVITGSPWTKYIADEITRPKAARKDEEL